MPNYKYLKYDADRYVPSLWSRALFESRLPDDEWQPPVEFKFVPDGRGLDLIEVFFRTVEVVDSTS